jgi:hypothetical protein
MNPWFFPWMALGALPRPAAGPDSQYCTTQFGDRARLLGTTWVSTPTSVYRTGALRSSSAPC